MSERVLARLDAATDIKLYRMRSSDLAVQKYYLVC
jgi:hypothetical protein